MKIGEFITASAIMIGESIFVGKRHCDCIKNAYKAIGKQITSDCEQGFYTSRWRFIDRKEAFELATQNGQIVNHNNLEDGFLYSENLW